jgi:hypothetical protein
MLSTRPRCTVLEEESMQRASARLTPTHDTARAMAGLASGLLLSAAALAPGAASAAEPVPTPTPCPHSLAAYASGRPLVAPDGDPITITNRTLEQHRTRGALTTAAGASEADPGDEEPPGSAATADPEVRRRWRRAYARQSKVIATLERERTSIAAELHQVRREGPGPRTFAREDALEAELEQLEADLRRERAALASIVREARQEGAVPGWFRGLS